MTDKTGKSVKEAIEKLVRRETLTEEATVAALDDICNGADSHLTAGFLLLLRAKGEAVSEVTGLVKAMRSRCVRVNRPYPLLDIVGTGGDGHDTVNISTAASILAAACGVKVGKHGNRSVSSRSGSADVLESFGVHVAMGPKEIEHCIENAGIAFMFAPTFHPAMKSVVPVRKALGVRTVFNILGPLLNPSFAGHMVIGVYTPDLIDLVAGVLVGVGATHGLVLHCCGLDELAPIGIAEAAEIKNGKVERVKIDPSSFGVESCTIADLKGGDADENMRILTDLFKGGAVADGPIGRTVALNAGAGLYVAGAAESIAKGYETALATLKAGKAIGVVEKWVSCSKEVCE